MFTSPPPESSSELLPHRDCGSIEGLICCWHLEVILQHNTKQQHMQHVHERHQLGWFLQGRMAPPWMLHLSFFFIFFFLACSVPLN